LRLHLDEVGAMKFRYAGRVQQSLIDNEAILDISTELTRINCEIADMEQVDITRRPVDLKLLYQMMQQQAMDSPRQQRWREFIDGSR
jgi:hypothetical protein